MTDQQKETLQASMSRFGFKTLILVAPVEGGFEVLDGHHRWEQAKERGMEHIPAIIMEDPDADMADLAMLSFNVTAEIIPDVYLDFLKELDLRVGSEVLAQFTSLDAGFLEDLTATLSNPNLDMDLGMDEDDAQDRTRGTGINVVLPATSEMRLLLDRVKDTYGLSTDADACVAALRHTLRQGDSDDSATDNAKAEGS